ncbi:MAG: hypothetical protein HYZ22_00795 [Chloroflexi bacterium]|nr:hypothetical protein [Chloroflexota bacterium]
MITSIRQTSIRRILFGNAIFSGVSGLLFTFASASVARFLGIENASRVILLLGIGLVGYVALIYVNASRTEISRSFVLFAVIGDSTWVLLSIVLLLTGWVPFSVEGKWVVGIIAAIVDVFATLQFLEWRKM